MSYKKIRKAVFPAAGLGTRFLPATKSIPKEMLCLVDKPLIDPAIRLRTLCHVTPGEWMLEGIGFYCGMAMRWYRDAFCDSEASVARSRGVDPYVVMEETAAMIPPGSNGVLAILSNLMNARKWVHASPSFLQFDVSNPAGTGRAACIRAIEEAAAYVVRGHLGIIGELTNTRVTGLTFTGGAAKGTLWPQIIADVLGLPVTVPAVTESSALGAALCAGRGAGLYASLTELEGELRQRTATFEPDPAAVAAYDDSYAAWRQIYPRMLDLSEEGLLNPLQADIEAIARLKQPTRKDRDWVNHLTTVAEGAPCVGWVTVVSYFCCESVHTRASRI